MYHSILKTYTTIAPDFSAKKVHVSDRSRVAANQQISNQELFNDRGF